MIETLTLSFIAALLIMLTRGRVNQEQLIWKTAGTIISFKGEPGRINLWLLRPREGDD